MYTVYCLQLIYSGIDEFVYVCKHVLIDVPCVIPCISFAPRLPCVCFLLQLDGALSSITATKWASFVLGAALNFKRSGQSFA